MSILRSKIEHVVVLMLEDRAMDGLLGWLYENDAPPNNILPVESPKRYEGLDGISYSNPLDLNRPDDNRVAMTRGVEDSYTPDYEPNSRLRFVMGQFFAHQNRWMNALSYVPPKGTKPNMEGFLADYHSVKCITEKRAKQIMQSYTPDDLKVLSGLAKAYGVSDNYHASVPAQTWSNRDFFHAGTSLGFVDNFPFIPHNIKTLFHLFSERGISWNVYGQSKPFLTRSCIRTLRGREHASRFQSINAFLKDCAQGTLPKYSLLESALFRFTLSGWEWSNSYHAPSNIMEGEHFLKMIWDAILKSPLFEKTLFIVLFDEGGGHPDHIPPNWTAIPPDESKGKQAFTFELFGARVPLIFASPYIPEQTVFRASKNPFSSYAVPFDHTSILAMFMDWQGIPREELPSKRLLAIPKNPFDMLFSLEKPRRDRPTFEVKIDPYVEGSGGALGRFIGRKRRSIPQMRAGI